MGDNARQRGKRGYRYRGEREKIDGKERDPCVAVK